MLLNPGIGVADDRSRGWLRVKKTSATPIGVVLAARVLAALPYAVGVVLAMSAVSVLIAGPVLTLPAWLGLVGALLLGGLPFALFGLAVGFAAGADTAAAVLNAVLFPMVIASGLWVPLELLPGFLQAIAPFLPTYHLARLATAALTGGPVLVPVLALLATTAVGALTAAHTHRRMRV